MLYAFPSFAAGSPLACKAFRICLSFVPMRMAASLTVTAMRSSNGRYPCSTRIASTCSPVIVCFSIVGCSYYNLVEMRFARPVLIAVIAVALAAYAFDYGAMTTPEQAMQCCNSTPCSSQGHHGQDCCKTMPAMHAPFVQPSLVHGIPYSTVMVAVLKTSDQSHGLDSSASTIAEHSHAPPIYYSSAPLPLRI